MEHGRSTGRHQAGVDRPRRGPLSPDRGHGRATAEKLAEKLRGKCPRTAFLVQLEPLRLRRGGGQLHRAPGAAVRILVLHEQGDQPRHERHRRGARLHRGSRRQHPGVGRARIMRSPGFPRGDDIRALRRRPGQQSRPRAAVRRAHRYLVRGARLPPVQRLRRGVPGPAPGLLRLCHRRRRLGIRIRRGGQTRVDPAVQGAIEGRRGVHRAPGRERVRRHQAQHPGRDEQDPGGQLRPRQPAH
mmetsp:Transcript_14016/g.38374  ORF Transcript_14016/g.38374 Transcript_14016/m.38374 type:complete len:243 (+) Transcript_14016:258-986(+)